MTKSNTKRMTKSGLARILGTTRHNILYHIRAGKAPKNLDDIEAWRSYLTMVGREGTSSIQLREAMSKEKLAILCEVRRAKQRDNMIKDGQVFDSAEVNRFITDCIHNCFFGELDRLAYEFPSTLKARDEIAIHEEVLREIESVKRTLRGRLDAWQAMNPKSNEKGKQ